MDIKEIYRIIGNRIRNERIKRGMTLEELGEKVERDWSYLSQIERGKSAPSLETLVRISEVLNIPLSNLFKLDKPNVKYKSDPYLNKIHYILKDKDEKYKKVISDFLQQISKH